MNQKSNEVSVITSRTYEPSSLRSALEELLAPLGGMENFVNSGDRVLVKPNLLSPNEPEQAVTTHPQMLAAVLQEILEAGAKPLVADSPGHGSFEKVITKTGLKKVCQEVGVPIVELTDPVEVPGSGSVYQNFSVAKLVTEVDQVVNLAKFKTHSQMVLTLAVKNCFGAVVGNRKMQWHLKAGSDRTLFARMLSELCLTINPDLNILEGIVGMDGDGPSNGRPVDLGLLLAGGDAFDVDLTACEFIDLDVDHYPALQTLLQPGLDREGETQIHGSANKLRREQFKLPSSTQAVVPFIPKALLSRIRKYFVQTPEISKQQCRVCGICKENCPAGAISIEKDSAVIDQKQCISCFCCQEHCPHGAVEIKSSLLANLFE